MKEALVIVEKLEKRVCPMILQLKRSTLGLKTNTISICILGEVGPAGEKGSKGAPGMIIAFF